MFKDPPVDSPFINSRRVMGDDSAVDIMCGLRNQSLESNISKVFKNIISFQLRVPKEISELVTGWKSTPGFFSKLIHISFNMGHQCIRKEEGGQTTCFGSQSMPSEYVCIKPVAYTRHLLIAVLRFSLIQMKNTLNKIGGQRLFCHHGQF